MRPSTTVPHVLRVLLAATVLTAFLLAAWLVDDAHAAPAPDDPRVSATAKPPAPINASQVLKSAEKYLGVPYVWGGFSPSGFDCSGYVTWIWEVPRRTTDSIGDVTRPITKEDLLPGDLLNMPAGRDPNKFGHMRLFDKWATADKALMWVFEETEPQVMRRVVPYDPRYTPVRRLNIVSDVPMPPPPPLPADWSKPPKRTAPAPVVPKPPGIIAGRVIDEKTGAPLARSRVFYWTESEQYSVSSVVTDKDGTFSVPKLAVGDYELAAYGKGYDVEFRGNIAVASGMTSRVELKLALSNGSTSGQRIGAAPTPGDLPARDVAPGDPPTALPQDHDIPGGHFFTQTSGRDGISGFAITDDGGVRFWSEFQRLGGVQALGYPVSRRFTSRGFTVQVMQKGVMQWRPEATSSTGGVGQAWLTNVFDEMHDQGKDDWLTSRRSTPRPIDSAIDQGKSWAQVVAFRQSFLDRQPTIDRRYGSVSDPMTFFGLPTSRVEDMGNHYAVRLQRAVIQLWKVDVPWAKAGETTVANGGDVAKEAGLFPSSAIAPQRSPLLSGSHT